ncbi:MAG: stage III sporulation protein AF [Bacillota bacterium]
MINFLRTWITNIAVVIIFIALLEILMPSGAMKRYSKVIAGLIIIMVIVKPFMSLKDIEDFKLNVFETDAYLDSNVKENGSQLDKYQKSQAIKLFESNIENQVKNVIAGSCGIEKDKIEVTATIERDSDKDGYGSLAGLIVKIEDKAALDIAVSKVETVKINGKEKVINENKPEYNLNDSKLSKEIKEKVSEYLGLREEAIEVYLQE